MGKVKAVAIGPRFLGSSPLCDGPRRALWSAEVPRRSPLDRRRIVDAVAIGLDRRLGARILNGISQREGVGSHLQARSTFTQLKYPSEPPWVHLRDSLWYSSEPSLPLLEQALSSNLWCPRRKFSSFYNPHPPQRR